MNLIAALAWLWSHKDYVGISLTSALALYMVLLPSPVRARLEIRYPRWRGVVGLVTAVFAHLPGVPPQVRLIVLGEVPPPPPPVADGPQRGSIGPRALLLIAVGLAVALPLGVALMSCVPARRFVLDVTPGVPSRVACVPRSQVCLRTDAGAWLPAVYSDECRAWPSLPLRPDGSQRFCATGEGCVVDGDGGVAHCTSADGGL